MTSQIPWAREMNTQTFNYRELVVFAVSLPNVIVGYMWLFTLSLSWLYLHSTSTDVKGQINGLDKECILISYCILMYLYHLS